MEVAATSNPGELDGVLHRAGSRHIVVAGGDGSLHAVVSALHRRNELRKAVVGLLPMGTGNDFARGVGIPLEVEEAARVVLDGRRPMDLIVDEVGEIVINNVHVGAGPRPAAVATLEGAARLGRRRQGKPRPARLPDRGGPDRLEAADHPDPGRGRRQGRRRPGPAGADGRGRQRLVGRGRNGAHPGRRPARRPARRDGLPLRGAGGPFVYAAHLGCATHHERDDVDYLRGTTVSISGGPFWCSADGEIYGPERQRTWHVEPGRTPCCCPTGVGPSSDPPPAEQPPPPPGSGSPRPARSSGRRRGGVPSAG